MEKPFDAPAVGSDREAGACNGRHPGEPAARGDGKQSGRERILPLSKWSVVAFM